MKELFVKITGIKDITDLVRYAQGIEGEVYVKKGIYCIDGKSLMGLFSIDISSGASIVYPVDAVEFENFIKQFAI